MSDIQCLKEPIVAEIPKQTAETIQIVAYDPTWPQRYLTERALVLQAIHPPFLAIEHVGSTAVPGLSAKPIIDMMAAVVDLSDGVAAIAALATLGYQLIETGMPHRLFLRKREPEQDCSFSPRSRTIPYASWRLCPPKTTPIAIIGDADAMRLITPWAHI
jgi:GrpB-like predicted nucleotidyltransferase (UPF0157 family)